MLIIRNVLILIGMLLSPAAFADMQVRIGIGLPHVSIGINVPAYPQLVVVPGYPVYYAPQLQANFFFYDGMYWVYQDDYWYASSWYNGPWWIVGPEIVPVYVLRIPVHYYRHPPAYFRGWRADAPPRWGYRWGRDWEQSRSGWNRWDSRFAPAPAPLPMYQRQYLGERYPRQVEQQHELHQQNYRYQPHEPVVRKHYEERAVQRAPARQEDSQQQGRGGAGDRDTGSQDMQRPSPRQQEGAAAPRSGPAQRGDGQRPNPDAATQARPGTQERRQTPEPVHREQGMPRSQEQEPNQQGRNEPEQGQGRSEGNDQGQRQGQDKGQSQAADNDQRLRPDQGQGREQEQERGGWDRYRTQ